MQGKDITDKSSSSNPYKLHRTLSGHLNSITKIEWSPDGKYFASSSLDNTIRLWNGNTGDLIHVISDPAAIWAISWSSDSQLLAVSCLDGTIRLYERDTGHALQTLSGHKDLVWSISW